MTYEERKQQVCDTCDNHRNTCGYRCRGLNYRCEYLQTIMGGWELGQEDTIDKACEWLKENKDHPLIGCEDPCLMGYLTKEFISEFRKAMEDEK